MIYIVCGTFDRENGRPSYLGSLLMNTLHAEGMNGGNIEDLQNTLFDFSNYKILIWLPNISNDEEKMVNTIKEKNPTLLLVSSKNTIGRKFDVQDMVGRLLMSRSNLGIMIDKPEGKYEFKLIDPLGNIYYHGNDVYHLAMAIKERTDFILSLTRVGSQYTGPATLDMGDEEGFLQTVREYADIFSKHINAVNPYRFLGNASTRCSFGFPAIRSNYTGIFVTRRNIDKRKILSDQFVRVEPEESKVLYYGEYKPSVDTPIQIRLFNRYPNIRYMIHGHVYIENAPTTDRKIPCGYIEEFDDICEIFDEGTDSIIINLKGHGCLVAASNLQTFKEVAFKSRPLPDE